MLVTRTRKVFASISATALLAMGALVPAAGAQQQGLVNVSIEGNQVTIPINAAANICGVTVEVLTLDIQNNPGNVTCDARGDQDVVVLGFA